MKNSLCVFCGSSNNVNVEYKNIAKQIGVEIGKRKIDLIYGGGSTGLMGELADGYSQINKNLIGIVPRNFFSENSIKKKNIKLIYTKDMQQRKKLMFEKAQFFLVLPGGLGTLEELYEIWSCCQLGIFKKKIYIYNFRGFFDSLLQFINELKNNKFIRDEDTLFLNVKNNFDDLMQTIDQHVEKK